MLGFRILIAFALALAWCEVASAQSLPIPQSKTALQAQNNAQFVPNTNGLITATVGNSMNAALISSMATTQDQNTFSFPQHFVSLTDAELITPGWVCTNGSGVISSQVAPCANTSTVNVNAAGLLGTTLAPNVVNSSLQNFGILNQPIVVNLNVANAPSTLTTGAMLTLAQVDTTPTLANLAAAAAKDSFTGYRANGTLASPTHLSSGDLIVEFGGIGYGLSTYASAQTAGIAVTAGQDWTDTAWGTGLNFVSTANDSTTPLAQMRLQPSGGLSLGTAVLGTDPGAGDMILGALAGSGTRCVAVSAAGTLTAKTLDCANAAIASATTGNIAIYTGANAIGGLATTGSGNSVRATSPTIATPTLTGVVTASGQVSATASTASTSTTTGSIVTPGGLGVGGAGNFGNTVGITPPANALFRGLFTLQSPAGTLTTNGDQYQNLIDLTDDETNWNVASGRSGLSNALLIFQTFNASGNVHRGSMDTFHTISNWNNPTDANNNQQNIVGAEFEVHMNAGNNGINTTLASAYTGGETNICVADSTSVILGDLVSFTLTSGKLMRTVVNSTPVTNCFDISPAVSSAVASGVTLYDFKAAVFGVNPEMFTTNTATNLAEFTGAEFDVSLLGTASYKAGITIVSINSDAAHGLYTDAAIAIGRSGGSVGFNNGLLFTDANSTAGAFPITTGGTVISSATNSIYSPWTVANAIDFSSLTISGFALKFANATLDGSGNFVGASLTTPILESAGTDISVQGNNTAASTISLNFPNSVSSPADSVRLFRNTAGATNSSLIIFKADKTGSIQTNLAADAASYLQALAGDLTIGQATDLTYKLGVHGTFGVDGASSLSTLSQIGNSTAFTADSWTHLIQNSTTTAANIYSPLVPAGWFYSDLFRSTLNLGSSSTAVNTNNYGGYLLNNLVHGGNGQNAVIFFGLGVSNVDGAKTWVSNSSLDDSAANTSLATANRFLLGNEFDFTVNSNNSGTTVEGVSLELTAFNSQPNANGFQVSKTGTGNFPWSNSFISDSGASQVALIAGALSASGTNIAGQPIESFYFDGSAVGQTWNQSVNVQGNYTFSNTPNNFVVVPKLALSNGPVIFNGSVLGSSAQYYLAPSSGTFVFNAPTGDVFGFEVNGSLRAQISNASFTLSSGVGVTAPGLATVGVIAGSVCATSGGLILYESGATGCTISRLDLKQDVASISYDVAAADLARLNPVSFAFKTAPKASRLGFYAENTLAADSRFATYDGNGELQAYDPNAILAATVAVVKHLEADNDNLKREIETLKRSRK